jgi:hypothetical protein
MSNVLQLFKNDNSPDPKTTVAIAIASILSSKDQLARKVEELSKHADAVGHSIEAFGDTEPRNWAMRAEKLNRERLRKGMLELSQAAEKLSAIQLQLAEAVARRARQIVDQDRPETVMDGQQET